MDLAEGIQVQNTPSDSIAVPDAQPEKVLKQSEVNELVGRIKHEAYSKGLRMRNNQLHKLHRKVSQWVGCRRSRKIK